MKRIRLKRKKKLSLSDKIVLIICIVLICLFFLFKYVSTNVTPVFMNYAEVEARKFINAVINKAIIDSKIKDDELFNIHSNNEEIDMIDLNMDKVNDILSTVNLYIQDSLRAMDEGESIDIPGYDSSKLKKGIIYELPTGLILKNNLLSNIGPKIPIKLSMRGSILSNIETNITNYGINNAMIKISIRINVDQQIVLPFTLKKVNVDTSIPIIIKIVKGNIPKYYGGGINSSTPYYALSLEEN